MPKIRDLGINLVPETMRPPEIGDGGGGCGVSNCPATSPLTGFTGFTPGCTATSPLWTAFWGCPITTVTATTITITPTVCTATSPVHNFAPRPALDREAIRQLKAQLQQQIEQLDEYAKSIGPKSPDEIDAREKELKAELEELAERRKEYKK